MPDNEKNVEIPEEDKQIFEAIAKSDVVLLKTLLANRKNVDIVDEHSMTPLQHAAYKGNKEIVQMLLDQGADVNHCEHQHNYTALHFAGLSGNVDVCLALLLAGAKSHITNTVGRTAAQMAAFVGHHNCVATINNYIPKSDVDYYTKPQGSSKEPLLPPFLAESFHKFIMQVNIHPVKVVMNLQNFVGLMEHLQDIKKVLQLMSEKEMKKGSETNEVMSFKFHYLSFIVNEVSKIKEKDIVEIFARKILKPTNDQLEFMDNFLKQCIKEFPFRECTLLRQMVAGLATPDPPTALSVVSAAINGQRGFVDNIAVCSTCGEEKPAKKCSKCKVAQYCDQICQKYHWHWHKKSCAQLAISANTKQQTKPDAAEISADMQNLLVQ